MQNSLKNNKMLRGILYETVSVDAAGATIRLLPESPVYKGHFPGYPITPGVCLVEIALELMEEMADQVGHDGKPRLVAAKNIKFTSPVIPSETTELRFNISGEGVGRTVEILAGETLCAKMSLTVE
jgi:3-hydroxyacyl-[acyl-carrier-protein] dehydratase